MTTALRPRTYELVIFDWDGTLADSASLIASAFRQTLEESGFATPEETRILGVVGLPLEECFHRLVPAASSAIVDRLCREYRRIYRVHAVARARLFDGVEEMLRAASGAGLRMAIATSKSLPSVTTLLRHHALSPHFEVVLGRHCVANPKPHPEMVETVLERVGAARDRTLMVGDTSYDVEMGERAGVATCAVTWGMQSPERLAALSPTHVVGRVKDLAALLLPGGAGGTVSC